ncbi:hypothetical protein CTAYLR_001928 [Chrysophaeum taylorii]|uniref:DUS-like FMN-binding domain-containing protein n=1 Tax=Chrysophaeum taylorii TaxID=2483200 RepID=A0AAD7U8L4_9STRA|nr:hypothetical protein CTAYLR_001928 [Chrysophaeum taylorii]
MEPYPYPLSVAPMMEVTDRHWRYFARGLTRETLLYSEMYVDQTLIHAKSLRPFLGHRPEEVPVAVQLGGNDPESLAKATELVVSHFGDACVELNLNCGCPSHAVAAKNCFGARLMLDPSLVRRCVSEMRRRSPVPVTVKHRLGTDLGGADYDTTLGFVREVSRGGARHFVVHARMAILGRRISTEQNRTVPPLLPDVAHRLAEDLPDCTFAINGGLASLEDCALHLRDPNLASAMIGRAAWTRPCKLLATADTTFFGKKTDPGGTLADLVYRYADYADDRFADTLDDPRALFRPLYYAFAGDRGAKQFRIRLVDAARRLSHREDRPPSDHIADALRAAIPSHVLDRHLCVQREDDN